MYWQAAFLKAFPILRGSEFSFNLLVEKTLKTPSSLKLCETKEMASFDLLATCSLKIGCVPFFECIGSYTLLINKVKLNIYGVLL